MWDRGRSSGINRDSGIGLKDQNWTGSETLNQVGITGLAKHFLLRHTGNICLLTKFSNMEPLIQDMNIQKKNSQDRTVQAERDRENILL